MLYVPPSLQFEASVEGFAPGLVGTLAYQVTNGAETTVIERTTSGISEYPVSSGIYTAVITAPSSVGQYQIVWDDGSGYATQELVVTTSGYAPDPPIPGPAVDQVLTSEELNLLRNSLGSWYPDTVSIYRKPASADDVYGGHGSTSAYVLLREDLPCELDSSPKNDQERTIYGLVGDTHSFFVTLAANTDVSIDDKLVITSRENLVLRVTSVIAPESWEFERRVLSTTLGV